MAALVKMVIVFVLSLIGLSETVQTTRNNHVTDVKRESCNPHIKCVHASFHGKYDLQVYQIEKDCTT